MASTLWISQERHESALRPDVRRVIGLLTTCGWTDSQVQSRVGRSVPHLRAILKALHKSRDPLIRTLLARGLSLGGEVEIFWRVRCRQCMATLTALPCIACRTPLELDFDLRIYPGELPQSDVATDYLPGTPEKMLVMQQRAALGYSVFCDGDRPINAQRVT